MEKQYLDQNLVEVSAIESCAIYGGRSTEVGEAVRSFGYIIGIICSVFRFRKRRKSSKTLAFSN